MAPMPPSGIGGGGGGEGKDWTTILGPISSRSWSHFLVEVKSCLGQGETTPMGGRSGRVLIIDISGGVTLR